MAGLTLTGFEVKTLAQSKAELDELFKNTFGVSLGSEPDGSIPPDSVAGQLVGLLADREAEIWEVMQALSSSFDPDNATGKALVALCALTGTLPNPERKSSGVVVLTGDPGTVLTVGRGVSEATSGARFLTTAAVTLSLDSSWATSTAYAVGDRVTNGASPARIYQATVAGTSAVLGSGPSGTSSVIADGSVTWTYCGEGTASGVSAVESVEAGPYAAATGTLTVIDTPITGWLSVRNLADIKVGAYLETDAALRIRRENEITGNANGTLDAIRAKLLRVGQGGANPVLDCVVFENTTMVVSVDGLPPKSIEAIVLGGDDQALFDTVLATKDAGIESHGNTVGSSNDSAGFPHVVKFTRPTEKLVWIELDLIKDVGRYPLDGDAQCKQAILDWHTSANGYTFGKDATVWGISTSLYKVPGVLKVSGVRLGFAPAPVGTADLPIAIREIARFDSSRITISSTGGTP